MNAVQTELLLAAMHEAAAAPHGAQQAIYQRCAQTLQVSLQTVYRWRARLRVGTPARKRRTDARTSALTYEEARAICWYMNDATRANGKRLPTLRAAVAELRANGVIAAGSVDPQTGEFTPLSLSAIANAMKTHNWHPEQLATPRPAVRMKTDHPNELWEIDPSLCVLYYLPTKRGQCLQVMDEKVFYKNKPANIRRIERERVWRYVITDHASGAIYVHYVLGAESGRNLVEAFIGATQKSASADDPFQGIPQMVMVDPGSANTGAVFRNLCHQLGIVLQVNTPHQPRGKGQVEGANNLIEREFEHRLALMANPPTSLQEINELAWQWMRHYNATAVHSRTGTTRYAAWMRITAEQLVLAPPPERMRAAAVCKPETRVVNAYLEISYAGRAYAVDQVPDVHVGARLLVTRNAFEPDSVQVIYRNADGQQCHMVLAPKQKDDFGFYDDAVHVGKEYRAHADTILDTRRKELERFAMQADTDTEAQMRRRAGAKPLAAQVDPMKSLTDVALPHYLPRRGTEHAMSLPAQVRPLTLYQAANALSRRLGSVWRPEHYQYLLQRYPQGLPESQLDDVAHSLQRGAVALRAVGAEG